LIIFIATAARVAASAVLDGGTEGIQKKWGGKKRLTQTDRKPFQKTGFESRVKAGLRFNPQAQARMSTT